MAMRRQPAPAPRGPAAAADTATTIRKTASTIRRRLRRLPVAVGLAAALTAVWAGAAAAHTAAGQPPPVKPAGGAPTLPQIDAPVPAGFTSWSQVFAVQQRLNRAAEQISAAARTPDGAGFGALTAAPQDREVHLYWKGALPAAMTTLLAKVRAEAPVRMLAARYSAQEMAREAARILGRSPVPGAHVTGVGPLPDASGLQVSVRESTVAPASMTAADGSGMRVVIRPGVAPKSAYDRFDDTSPYWGGAAWHNGTPDANGYLTNCSTGFAVLQNGVHKLLTASHCANNGDDAWTGSISYHPTLQWVGTVEDKAPWACDCGGVTAVDDVELLDPTTEPGFNFSTNPKIYDGAETSGVETDATSAPVVTSANTFVGSIVFADGAASGRRDINQVKYTDETEVGEGGLYYTDLAEADQAWGKEAAGSGDSGGPVGAFDGYGNVYAYGVISEVDAHQPVTCVGVQSTPSSPRTCSSRFWYTQINDVLSRYGATLLTS